MMHYFLILLLREKEHMPHINLNFFETRVNFKEERPNGIDNDRMKHFININDEGVMKVMICKI